MLNWTSRNLPFVAVGLHCTHDSAFSGPNASNAVLAWSTERQLYGTPPSIRWPSLVQFNGRYRAGIFRKSSSAKGTLFALVTDSNGVAQFDDEFNVKFRANRLRNWLALAEQLRVPTSGSFWATEKFSLPRFHKTTARLAMPRGESL